MVGAAAGAQEGEAPGPVGEPDVSTVALVKETLGPVADLNLLGDQRVAGRTEDHRRL